MKLSSHWSFVINMYVVTMAWRCISLWSFHRSYQRRRKMDIFRDISRFPRILSKNNQKRKEKSSIERSYTLTIWKQKLQLVSGSTTCKTQSPIIAICTTCAKIITKWKFLTTQYPCSTANGTGISSQPISRNLAFFQGVFLVLERYIGFEPWDLFPLTIKCYRKCLQNYKGTIFVVAWTEKYMFEIINAVTDEPKATFFSVIRLIISTD